MTTAPRRFSSTTGHALLGAALLSASLCVDLCPASRSFLAQRFDPWTLLIALLALQLAAGIAFLSWVYRAYANLTALGCDGSWTPGAAVFAFFIPLFNLYAGYRVCSELWRASKPGASDGNWKRAPEPSLLPIWWACVTASSLHFIVFGQASETARAVAFIVSLAALLATVPTVVGTVFLMLGVAVRQQRSARA
jgi:hypothetical protein